MTKKEMGHNTCCVVNCKNNGKNNSCKFYTFPKAAWKLEQRKKWIAAVKRKNLDGSLWSPKSHDTICSAHFIGGKKSEAQASPSYVPTIFPVIYRKKKIGESQIVARYKRFMARSKTKVSPTIPNQPLTGKVTEVNLAQLFMVNQGCQIDMYSELELKETTFTCNRYIYSDHCDAEIQVEIATTSRISTPKKQDESCCTTKSQYFVGISSVKCEK